VLKGAPSVTPSADSFQILRSLPHVMSPLPSVPAVNSAWTASSIPSPAATAIWLWP
jgi:hypothetical protein